jgi:hypothetical protein
MPPVGSSFTDPESAKNSKLDITGNEGRRLAKFKKTPSKPNN